MWGDYLSILKIKPLVFPQIL